MMDPEAAAAARASEALVDALREAHELVRSGAVGKPLADVLWFCDDMLDVMAEYVERPNAGEGERGAFMEMRERVAALRAQLRARRVSPAAHSLPDLTAPTAPLVVFPFRYRDPRTGRWVKARYKAERTEIAARYAEWEIIGPGEERRPVTGYFNPGRREGD